MRSALFATRLLFRLENSKTKCLDSVVHWVWVLGTVPGDRSDWFFSLILLFIGYGSRNLDQVDKSDWLAFAVLQDGQFWGCWKVGLRR